MRKKYDGFPKTSFIGRFLLVCGLLLGFGTVGEAVTLWQNTNTTTIIANNSISCNLAGNHTNNSYWRAFTPATFGLTGTFSVTGVRIGVEESVIGSGANQPLTVRIYTNTGGAFPGGTRTLIGTTDTTVAAGNLFFQDIAVTAPVQPVAAEIVVEIFTPDGIAANHRFFIGSNNLGQSAPSYISAADCGAPNPVTAAASGAPNMHTLIGLVGTNIQTTAASVSIGGRVLGGNGRGLINAVVTLTDAAGDTRTARTTAFGYFRFADVAAGETYIVSVFSKRYLFAPQVVNVTGELTALEFFAGP